MVIANGLFIAKVAHQRVRPKKNGFCYSVYYLSFPLRLWQTLGDAAVLSLEKFNLFSLKKRDYGKDAEPETWIRELLTSYDLAGIDGEVVLVTLPRVLGYAFNPVSFWFCLDKAGALRAVLAEVSNTFGERHCYLLFHDDKRIIANDDWLTARKVFHVSPFIEVNGYYQFRFAYGEDKIGVWINHYDEGGLLLTTSMTGKRMALTSFNLMHCFVRYPLVTLKVISLIHYHALKLFLKGIRYRIKPPPPSVEISR